MAALIMLVFYITNYVVQPELTGDMLPTPSGLASIEAPVPTVNGAASSTSPASQESEQPIVSADATTLRSKFADKFTDGYVDQADTSYKSANINVSINKVQKNGVTYFLADIYVADIQYFKTAFAKQSDVMGARESTKVVADENDAILAINGDHCVDNSGPVVRNGQLYRNETYADALVMNYDGSMQTYSADQLNMDVIKADGAWQVWTFGPMLLKDGQPMTEFSSTLGKANPRTAVGYYEPGHYCFLVVDGRQPGYSDGMTFTDMSQLFYDLGCKAAFNLDGGQSSEMVFMGNVANQPYNGGRSTTDILYIADK
ncbi:MAG: phosphodiester glycosidase family protein [Eubacteriales bacterium]|nr:phosphodiester glycosidase family protein [Eubacteriales bacterium]